MNPWNSIPSIGEGRARTAMPEHGAPYGTPGAKVSIAPLLHPPAVVPEVTSQEDEAFQALPAVTADEMRGAEGMSDQMNWAFDQATHDMHVRVAEGMADLADQMDGVFKPKGDDAHRDVPFTHHPNSGLAFFPPLVVTRRNHRECEWLYNPWTGTKRNAVDVEDDPTGLMLRPPGWPVFAASKPAPQETQPATVLSSPSTHLSAWFDASGALHGSVSDEQLVALCRNAIAAIERRNGWFDEMTAAMAATPPDSKPTNPKDAVGDTRVPLSLLSPIAKAHWALAQHCGRTKYGAWNWREAGARASVYLSAIQRHADGYLSGETNDPADGTHHLGNIMACCAILLEAEAAGKLQDDRPPVVGIREVYAAVEKQQAVLTAKYADRRPRHWTIGDTP